MPAWWRCPPQSHSLRNPLASIRSSAELAQVMPSQPAVGNIADIIAQVDRMSGWVNDLLQYLRSLRGEAESVDLVAITREAVSSFEAQLQQSRIRTTLAISGKVEVISHTLLLGQVLNSVLANAIEAMPEGGELRLSLKRSGTAEALLLIDDTGPGISVSRRYPRSNRSTPPSRVAWASACSWSAR
jgi:two-component system sensor histidine kinase HydH